MAYKNERLISPDSYQLESESSEGERLDILILASSGWKCFGPLNCHFIAKHLSDQHRVLFVESIGLRWPNVFSRHDWGKVWSRIGARLFRKKKVEDTSRDVGEVDVISVMSLPVCRWRWVNEISLKMVKHQLKRALNRKGMQVDIIWSFMPYMKRACEGLGGKWAYQKVDFYEANIGVAADVLLEMEKETLEQADVTIGTSKPLVDQLKGGREEVVYWPNVGAVHMVNDEMPLDMSAFTNGKKVVGYVGNFAEQKIDLVWLCEVIEMMHDFSFVFIGQVNEGGGRFDDALWQRLLNYENVAFLGPREYERIGQYIKHFDVGLIPFKLTQLTHGSFPLKTLDYMGVGVPVVSRRIGSLEREGFKHGIYLVDDARDCVERIRRLCDEKPNAESIREVASNYTWEQRYREIDILVEQLIYGTSFNENKYDHGVVSAS